jgi:4-amino-4-deoxy-L-arabinose transferase-like glycosyltransferase
VEEDQRYAVVCVGFMKNFLNKKDHYILALILINAFLMRWCGLEYGLPYIYSDESVFIVPATRMLLVGDMNPHWFGHPGSFLMYVLAIFFGVITIGYFIYQFIIGQVHNFSEFRVWFTPELYRNELRPFYYYSGRLFTVALSLVLIILTYRLGKKLFGKPVGLLAAFCLSIAPLNICVSRMVRTDILGAVLVVLVISFLIRYLDFPQKRSYLFLASLLSGFSAATKYTIGAVFIPFLFCSFQEDIHQYVLTKGRPLFYWLSLKRNFAGVCLWAFFGFFIAAPFVFLDFRQAIQHILFENSSSWLGIQRLPWLMKYWWYLSEPLRSGIGGLFF